MDEQTSGQAQEVPAVTIPEIPDRYPELGKEPFNTEEDEIGSAWRTADPTMSPVLPRVPACYVLVLDGHMYVGSTRNLRHRLSDYRIHVTDSPRIITPWGAALNWSLKYRPSRRYGDWAMVELRLIRRLKPDLNCVGSIGSRKIPRRKAYGEIPLVDIRGGYAQRWATVDEFVAGTFTRMATR